MRKILLLNAESVQAVCMARSLRKLGHYVIGFCSQKVSSGYATRWLNEKHIIPSIICDKDGYMDYLFAYLQQYTIDLIIPLADDSADLLSFNKERIETELGAKCAIPQYLIFDRANNKHKLMMLCEENDIPHPKTREIRDNSIDEIVRYVGFPAMIKPNISQGAKGIMRVDSMKELTEKYSSVYKQFGECTLQQYVEQPDYYYNVMLFRKRDGRTAASTVIKIQRYFPLKGGSSCYSETVDHPLLLDQCERCLERLNWHGFADFDVLEDKTTGELKIIEINPRVPSSLQASFAAGVNFAKIFVDEYLGKGAEVFNMINYKTGQQVRWFGLDVMWFLMSPQRFSYKPSWFRFWGKNVSYHDGSWNDPLPMIAGSLQGVIKYLDPDFRKAKLKG